jgi:hypothetical protein
MEKIKEFLFAKWLLEHADTDNDGKGNLCWLWDGEYYTTEEIYDIWLKIIKQDYEK